MPEVQTHANKEHKSDVNTISCVAQKIIFTYINTLISTAKQNYIV